MTATKNKPTLPDFEGAEVHKAALKFSGAGTGLSDGLTVQPVALETGETVYFVGSYECRGVHHDLDKDDMFVRIHKLQTIDMAPIDKTTAERVITEYNEEIKRRQDEVDGQLRLDAEAQAEERDAQDRQAAGSRRSTQLSSVAQPEFSKPGKP